MNWRQTVFYHFSRCDLCGISGDLRSCVCSDCLHDLPFIQETCFRCGLPVPKDVAECGKCLNGSPPIDSTITAFHYRYPVDALIKRFKYNDNIRVAAPLTDALVERILARNSVLPGLLIPVPLHNFRLYRRGYNQAVVISRLLTRRLGIATDSGLVKRLRNTAPMFSLNAAQRRKNISGVFELRRSCPCTSVAIVDDVITSGATVNELARTLRSAGVLQIQLWALARAD